MRATDHAGAANDDDNDDNDNRRAYNDTSRDNSHPYGGNDHDGRGHHDHADADCPDDDGSAECNPHDSGQHNNAATCNDATRAHAYGVAPPDCNAPEARGT